MDKRFLIVMHFGQTLRQSELNGWINTALDKAGCIRESRSLYSWMGDMLITCTVDEGRIQEALRGVEAEFGVGAFSFYELKRA